MYPTAINPLEMYELADDFHNLDTVKWTSVDDGGTGTNTANAVAGGEISVVTAAADNDYHFLAQAAKAFKMAASKPLWLVSRLTLTEANTNAANVVAGVASDHAATIMGANGGGPSANFSGAVFYKVDGDLLLKFCTSNATVQTKSSSLLTITSGRVYQLGFHWDSGDGTTSLVTPWVYDETAGTRTVGAPHRVALASLAAMGVIFGIKAGSASAETLKVDYIRCAQKR